MICSNIGVHFNMLKSDMLPATYAPSKDTMENKILLRSRISLVRIRT
jgi:hypothetical protein